MTEKREGASGGRTAILRATAGFSLVELIIALAILGTLLSISIPAFRSMGANQRVTSVAADLHAGLLLARAEAVKRNRSVRIRPGVGKTWSDGWLVPDPATPGADTNPLMQQSISASVKITGSASYFEFSPSGRVKTDAAQITLDDGSSGYLLTVESTAGGSKKSCKSVGLNGRVRSEKCAG